MSDTGRHSPREAETSIGIAVLAILAIAAILLVIFGIRLAWLNWTPCSWHNVKDAPVRCINERVDMAEAKYTLKLYTGVGSGVYKHGTIVKVVDGKPVVVGHFDDQSGKDYPGTVQIEEVKQ
ncbi:MAG TPA: hypothetical protein VD907_07075 [Verrucomicrobiae bacterium]|nr:hypothetical protein [Verrucomicrobiae bacterium]